MSPLGDEVVANGHRAFANGDKYLDGVRNIYDCKCIGENCAGTGKESASFFAKKEAKKLLFAGGVAPALPLPPGSRRFLLLF
jgi:hypothetical protein